MKVLSIILFILVNSIIVFGQDTPIYHIIPKRDFITPIIEPPHDSIIDNLHKYVNFCRLNVTKTSERINLDLSEYPKVLPPLERSNLLDKEAQRRCYDYVKFYINHHFFTHMYSKNYSGELLTGGIQYDDLEETKKLLSMFKTKNIKIYPNSIKFLEDKIKHLSDDYNTINGLLYEDGPKKVVTGHRDALLTKNINNDYKIGLGYVKYHYVEIEKGKEVKKYIEFLVVIVQHESTIDDILNVEQDKFHDIVKGDKMCEYNYKHDLHEKDLMIYTKAINGKK